MILLPEKLEINSIDLDENKGTPKKIIQANLIDLYNIKLCKIISLYFPIKSINICHFSDLSIDTKDCICQFNCL